MSERVEHHFQAQIRAIDLRQIDGLPEDIEDPFVFTSESSNNSLDFYFTHMTERTLRNFAQDASAGVQFLDSHNNMNLGYGRSLAGRFEILSDRRPDFDLSRRAVGLAIDPPEQYMRTLIDTYTVPGIRFGGGLTYASTDDFIRAARAQIAKDISVGFYGGDWVCDICGGNYRRYSDCPHLAGLEYPLGEQGERIVVATVSVDGARLAEHSAVYDGATPQAMIIKAERMAQAGELEPEKIRQFELRYKYELARRIVSPGLDLSGNRNVAHGRKQADSKNQRGNERMNENGEQQEPTAAEQLLDQVRAAVAESAAPEDAALPESVRWLVDEVARLRPLADDGRTYRADLIESALAEGVRANGDEFALETYQAMLDSASIEVIKRMRDDWQRLGNTRFPGSRQTVDEDEREQPTNDDEAADSRGVVMPKEAYRA